MQIFDILYSVLCGEFYELKIRLSHSSIHVSVGNHDEDIIFSCATANYEYLVTQ